MLPIYSGHTYPKHGGKVILPKRRYISTTLHSVSSQNAILFTITNTRSNVIKRKKVIVQIRCPFAVFRDIY
jgi:hypothetical protein